MARHASKNRTAISDRQCEILRFIEDYFNRHNFPPTIREIGQHTGIKSTSVVNYNLNKLVEAGCLARVGKASRGLRLLKDSGEAGCAAGAPVSAPNLYVVGRPQRTPRVPLVGQIVAGAPLAIPEDIADRVDEDALIEVTPAMLRGFDPAEVFALRVKGDSMIDAMIQDGDIVVLRRQNTAQNGDMVAVWLDERGETTLKHFFNEGERIRLQPAHPTMAPIYVSALHCQIQGRVLSVLRTNL